MRVHELMAQLQQQDPNATVRVMVRDATDAAHSTLVETTETDDDGCVLVNAYVVKGDSSNRAPWQK